MKTGSKKKKYIVFLRENQAHMKYEQGVFIDIFPIDGVPDNSFLRIIHNIHCTCIRKILWSEVGRIADKNVFMRSLYTVLSKIPEDKIILHYNKFIIKSNRKNTELVRILMFPTLNKQHGFPRKLFEESQDYFFEGYFFKGIKDYDTYLKLKYGDYMKLPPENKRKVHPVSDIKLVESILPEGVCEKR